MLDNTYTDIGILSFTHSLLMCCFRCCSVDNEKPKKKHTYPMPMVIALSMCVSTETPCRMNCVCIWMCKQWASRNACLSWLHRIFVCGFRALCAYIVSTKTSCVLFGAFLVPYIHSRSVSAELRNPQPNLQRYRDRVRGRVSVCSSERETKDEISLFYSLSIHKSYSLSWAAVIFFSPLVVVLGEILCRCRCRNKTTSNANDFAWT